MPTFPQSHVPTNLAASKRTVALALVDRVLGEVLSAAGLHAGLVKMVQSSAVVEIVCQLFIFLLPIIKSSESGTLNGNSEPQTLEKNESSTKNLSNEPNQRRRHVSVCTEVRATFRK